MDDLGVESSKDVTTKYLKILFWGDTGTRKTETILRMFPDVLLIDTEGNSDQCVDMPEIPEFARAKTKDARKILEIIKRVAAGKYTVAGKPAMTVGLDSASVLWSVQKEVAYTMGEKRAAQKGYDVSTSNATPKDWNAAKRPLKSIANLLSGSNIRFLIWTAREADQYNEDATKKTGIMPDVVKGTTYDMNLVLHFMKEGEKWSFETTKAQGALAKIFPIGKRQTKFPIEELLAYAEKVKKAPQEEDEEEVIKGVADEANDIPHDQKSFIEWAKGKGLPVGEIGAALKAAGFSAFNERQWKDMQEAVLTYLIGR